MNWFCVPTGRDNPAEGARGPADQGCWASVPHSPWGAAEAGRPVCCDRHNTKKIRTDTTIKLHGTQRYMNTRIQHLLYKIDFKPKIIYNTPGTGSSYRNLMFLNRKKKSSN